MYSMYTYLDTDCIDRFYLSEDFDANMGELVDHIVWLSYFLCSHQCNSLVPCSLVTGGRLLQLHSCNQYRLLSVRTVPRYEVLFLTVSAHVMRGAAVAMPSASPG